jgi:hypothetical protein
MKKICSQCHSEKELSLFYKNSKSKDGFRNNCKTCQNLTRDLWANKNKDKLEKAVKIYRQREDIKQKRVLLQKKWREKNLHWELWYKAKQRGLEQDLPFDIEPSDVIIPTHCPILGIELHIAKKNIGDSSPTIDKIFPEKGYVKNNIIVISAKANRIKNNSSVDELKKVYEWYKEQKYE